MAAVTSLGVHKPSALPYLIAEGILTAEAPNDSFRWHSATSTEEEGEYVEEDLVVTDHCVVWSRGGTVQRVFRFDADKEHIIQALFARFPLGLKRVSRAIDHQNGERGTTPDTRAEQQRTPPRKAPSRGHSTNTKPEQADAGFSKTTPSSSDKHRALVVILKTQAHVFFLTGTSHVVHLPFEVEAAFSLPEGILLQRKALLDEELCEQSPPSKQAPVAPPNSFAFSQHSFHEPCSSQGQSTLPHLRQRNDCCLPFPSMLDNIVQGAATSRRRKLPRIYSLSEPLSQLGTVGARRTRSENASTQSRSKTFETLRPEEDLLYASSEDELARTQSTALVAEPFLLAVTLDRQSNAVTVWNVTRVSQTPKSAASRRLDSIASGTLSRRRSSRGLGAATGANTPVPRGASTRDSFGGLGARARNPEDHAPQSIDDMSSQLDTVFDNPVNPAKSSRRVSSLLARADLSASEGNATFSELAGGYRGSHHAPRGLSLGTDLTRSSFTSDTVTGLHRTRPRKGLRTSVESQSLNGSEIDDDPDDLDDLGDLSHFDALDIGDGAPGLRQEYGLIEIHTLSLAPKVEASKPRGTSNDSTPTIYTLQPPNSSLREDVGNTSVYLCLNDRRTRTFLSLRIQVKALHGSEAKAKQRGSTAINGHHGLGYTAKVTDTARLSNVLDACKIQEHGITRILVLEESEDGRGKLTMHAPWSAPYELVLPLRFNIYNPFKITTGISSRQKREGGFRRKISQGPQTFSALQHANSQGEVDLVDSEGARHRIHVQLQPRSPLVKKMTKMCEAVMPLLGDQRELILCTWWTIVAWLYTRQEIEADIEWTALIVTLFSFSVGSIPDWHSDPPSRLKRRKVGLLRSSSGATTDLESWEAMLSQEAGRLGSSPAWMQDTAWQWVSGRDPSLTTQQFSVRSSLPMRPLASLTSASLPPPKKAAYLLHCGALAREVIKPTYGSTGGQKRQPILPFIASQSPERCGMIAANLLIGLHLLREEMKLDSTAMRGADSMTPILAQLGGWLGWRSWGFKEPAYYISEHADMENWLFDESTMTSKGIATDQPFEPPSILQHIEKMYSGSGVQPFISLLDLTDAADGPNRYSARSVSLRARLRGLTPRTVAIVQPFAKSHRKMAFSLEDMMSSHIDPLLLETLPESIAAAFRCSMSESQLLPSSNWEIKLLTMTGRDDLSRLGRIQVNGKHTVKPCGTGTVTATRDVHTISTSAAEIESVGAYDGSAEADRQSITRMIFKDDQRFAEAARLVHPLTAPTARCEPEPTWSDTELLEAQQELVKIIAIRTLSVSLGRSLLFYSARFPLITEKFPIHGFTLSCVMKPNNTTVTADRNAYTEEKVSWAFFHAGVEAGLSISKDAKGIDTSWILFNKPHELKNRHAGFLLALGLNGHLRNVAKWVSYNYLTPKHPMTSIGFLLGISASYLGTMDGNITRLLSVHVTRMLPPGAAELNLSPLTQTSGIMGIGLLYCNTQHRRMSEIMLSEIENTAQEENANPLEDYRDEGYRLAAGFALGYINLGRGRDLKGLHDMQIVERLLVLAIGTKKADLVHILDKATAAATVATALIFMKTNDVTLARKIDVPDTIHQFDHVRPDILLLRTVARHLIMWDHIRPDAAWMHKQLPLAFQSRRQLDARSVCSQELPYLNILAGLCLSLGLRYAGTGLLDVRNLLCHQLDQFMWMCRMASTNYDRRLTRITARNCQDTVALAAACVMAGTGDIQVFRRLRALHGRTDAETPYGSHVAAHMAIGVLFLGGGTHSLGTSNIAVASLLCAFYPLFPTTVLDNKSHLQAFRHFWVLAAEPRCLVVRDIDTHRPLSSPVTVKLRSGITLPMTAPCLLPDLATIATVVTSNMAYSPVNLDVAANPLHFLALKHHQTIFIRRRAAGDAHACVFSATMPALNHEQSASQLTRQEFNWIFTLPAFRGFDRADQALVLPTDLANIINQASRVTSVDDCLILSTGCVQTGRSERLWNLRLLFAWADALTARSGRWGWLREDIVTRLQAELCLKITGHRDE
ncbi:MAG: hypothetical protein L6R40_008323 [Gallowayella cf. fulva]|nr:MAG: hypothetical protein L6R40_008323 [Xanthomendoza cf. fulva]